MKNKFIIIISIVGIFLVYGFISGQENEPNITFPVEELGGCESKEECKVYCNNPDNIKVCVEFAEKNGLMSQEEVKKAKKFAEIGTGPGNCGSEQECDRFCNNPNNLDICIEFAERHGFLSDHELDDAKKIRDVLKEGGQLPGGCKDKLSCEEFCSDPSNAEECLAFAEKAGLIPKEELEEARKFLPLMQKGETPGGCKTKDQCEQFCSQEENMEQCAEFGLKIGVMSREEYEQFKKTGGRGPGGCRGRACETFCNDPANQEVCLKFAEEHGFIEKEKIEEVRKGMEQFKEHFTNMPPEVSECLNGTIGPERFQKLRNGEIMPGPEIGQAMRQCFESQMRDEPMDDRPDLNKPEGEFQNQMMFGPGGCSSPEECRKYCIEHEEECQRPIMHDDGQNIPMHPVPTTDPRGPENTFRPGGCSSEEECHSYCNDPAHAQECGFGGGNQIPTNPMPIPEGDRPVDGPMYSPMPHMEMEDDRPMYSPMPVDQYDYPKPEYMPPPPTEDQYYPPPPSDSPSTMKNKYLGSIGKYLGY